MNIKKILTVAVILLFIGLVFAPSINANISKEMVEFTTEICGIPRVEPTAVRKAQLSFAAFSDTHIGAKYQYFFNIPRMVMAGYLDELGNDLVNATNLLDFAIHLGDIVNHNTAHVNGVGLPRIVNQYKNNLKAFLISHVNLPFHCVIGNHDVNDYEMNCGDPHNLTKSLIDELSMNNPVYAMMRDGILFLVVPELGYVTWTHPVEYAWIEYMTSLYPGMTTIILCHQAIEDTTKGGNGTYRGKQDMDRWANLFQNNPQIKMWIHGHNHYLDWYVGNQSTGETYPIRRFGHEIAFSAPYTQMDWAKDHEEDRIVIYNITSESITAASWENNGAGGHWVPEYIHLWNVTTTYDPNAKDWYAFPMFLQDNETQITDMKLLSPDITLQLIGMAPMELFYDSHMEAPSGWAGEKILGFGNDRFCNVEWTDPGMHVHGPSTIIFPEKYPHWHHNHEDGRSGQPYHCFPMGTICAAVPGQTYNFTMTARCTSGDGRFNMKVSCSDWGTKSQYSVLPSSESQVFSHRFGSSYETIYGTYTVPDDKNAWFLQGYLDFLDFTNYDVSLFSVKRERSSDTTDDFHLYLSGSWYNVSGALDENERVEFSIDPQVLCDGDGVINFTAFINGNRYGMVNLIYREPLLLGRNARFRVNSYTGGVFNLTLTKTISRNFAGFKMLPSGNSFIGRILNLILSRIIIPKSAVFKMFPFSTDSMYDQVDIVADDGSGVKHTGDNGNLWLTCNCPDGDNRHVEIALCSYY